MAMRPRKTLADYMIIGISPALIIVLICSLIFFLMTVVYHGLYPTRLSIIVFLFIMAAVLITRISIEEGTEYASLFAIPLAVVTMLAMDRFVRVPGFSRTMAMLVNIGLMALTWWSAHKLTWNCTLIDEKEDASGEGLLQIMGVDQETSNAGDTGARRQTAEAKPSEHKTAEVSSSKPTVSLRQWFRNRRNRKPGVPGVWVVYFSLAALPLFGIGQLFIPASAVNERRIAFFMICTYAGSALGLLLTTSFLGLRRYLRQRRLPMPIDMAATWLAIGALLIALVLVGAVLLPRPGAAIAVSQLPFSFDSPDHNKPNRFGWGKEGAETRQPDSQPKPSITQPRSPRQPRPPHPSNGPSAQTRTPERSSGSDQNQIGSAKQSARQQQSDKMQPTSRPRAQQDGQATASRPGSRNVPTDRNGTKSGQSPGQKQGSQTPQPEHARSSGSQSGKTKDNAASNHGSPRGGKQEPRQQADSPRSDSQTPNQNESSPNSDRKDNQSGTNLQGRSKRQNDTSAGNMSRTDPESGNQKAAQDQRQPDHSRQQPDQKSAKSPADSPSDTTPPGKQTRPQDDQPKSKRDSSRSAGDRKSKQTPQQRQTRSSNEDSDGRKQPQDRKAKQPPKSDDRAAQQDRDKKSQGQANQPPAEQGKPAETPSQSFDPGKMLQSMIGGLGKLVKILFLVALLALIGFLAWKYRETIKQAIAQLLEDLRQLWQRLFGGNRSAGAGQQDADQLVDQPVRPFSSYSNPFSNGTAETIAPEKLVRYTFEALQAWAIQRHCPRAPEQTPLEFADRLAHNFPELGSETLLLADLYSRVAYGRQRVSSRRREPLRRLWRQMVATATNNETG